MNRNDQSVSDDVLLQLMSPTGRADPYPIYERLRKFDGVYKCQFGMYLVARYADCEYVLKNSDKFRGASAEELAAVFPRAAEHESFAILLQSLVGSNPPKHTRLRQAVGKEFSARRVAGLLPQIEATCDSLLTAVRDRLSSGEVVDLHRELALPLPLFVIGELLGIPEADRDALSELVPNMLTVLNPAADESALNSADRAFREFGEYLQGLIRERRRAPRDDLISALSNARTEGSRRLTSEDLMATLYSLWPAGFETTAASIDNSLRVLLSSSDNVAKWLRDEHTIKAFAEESLRFDPPVQFAPGIRFTAHEAVIAGTTLPPDAEVRVVLGAAHRDPNAYADPDSFIVGRRGSPLLAFGSGMHYCLGASLARQELEVVLGKLRSDLATMELVAEVKHVSSVPLRVIAALPVISRTARPAAVHTVGCESSRADVII